MSKLIDNLNNAYICDECNHVYILWNVDSWAYDIQEKYCSECLKNK